MSEEELYRVWFSLEDQGAKADILFLYLINNEPNLSQLESAFNYALGEDYVDANSQGGRDAGHEY